MKSISGRGLNTAVGRMIRGATTLAPSSRHLGYYVLALLLVLGGMLVRLTLTHFVGPGLPTYITFYPVVMLAALIGGWRPGLLATLTTALVVDYWLLAPQGSLKIESQVDLTGAMFFSAMGVFMSVVAELYRRTRGHLEELVIARTAALRQANGQLQQQAEELQTQSEELQMQAEELTTANEELRESTQALRESEERFRAAYEQAAIGIEMLDLEGRFLRGNGWLSQMLGYGEAELQRRTFAQITHPDDLQEELPLLEGLLGGKTPYYSLEKRYLHKNGHPIWVRVTSSLARTSTPYRISIIEDITERRRSEEALRELNATLENKVAQRTEELERRARQLQKLTLELSEADDHEIVREGLISLRNEAGDVEVVGEASNGREAINQAYQLQPDVVVMDVSMPLINGDDATRQIKMHLPQIRVIALSMYEEAEMKETMYRAGAESYVLKTAPSEELLGAIRGKPPPPATDRII